MRIGRHDIGGGRATFVIAEIGVNHDGSVDRALELVAYAKAVGADAVKVQMFRADRLMHRSAEFAEYQKDRVSDADPLAMLRRYELPPADMKRVAAAAVATGLEFIATPFSVDDVADAVALAAAVKIASPDLVNRRLLIEAITPNRPLLVSTGAAAADEIAATAAWLRSKSADFALLHCVSHYPVSPADANLRWIAELLRFGTPVGYSDHAMDPDAGALAVACGACVIEKHLTYDTNADGPDHAASLDPAGFADYVARIRKADRMLGRGGPRVVLDCERDVRRVSRQSLVVRRNLPAGHAITSDDVTTQRPGTGLSAERYEDVLGRSLRKSVRVGDMLSAEDVGL